MTKQDPQVTTTWMYSVRHRQSGWARAWVTSDGCLSIMSDWGSYAYWWDRRHPTDRNSDHPDFLCRAGVEYITTKLAGGKEELDAKATERGIKARITRLRREGQLTREGALREWELVHATSFDDEGDRWSWYYKTKLPEAWDALEYRTPMQLQMFMKHAWSLLVAEIQKDLVPATAPSTRINPDGAYGQAMGLPRSR